MLTDDDRAALEAWVLAARTYADSSQSFVSASNALSLASLDSADIVERLYGDRQMKNEHNGDLAEGLRDLATVVEDESRQQRDRHPATATAITELSKLFVDEI